jgi:transposase-like protein DUF772
MQIALGDAGKRIGLSNRICKKARDWPRFLAFCDSALAPIVILWRPGFRHEEHDGAATRRAAEGPFRPALEDIIDMSHPPVRLAQQIDWRFLDGRFGSVCQAGPGHPGLPTRLVAGLFILKHMHNLSDEALCARWLENPYYQYFCGEESFCHKLPFDRSSLTRWRQRLGEEQLVALIQESLSVAHPGELVGGA